MSPIKKRFKQLLSVVGLFVLLTGLAGCQKADVETRPNIILLMGDDHGWEETSYNGHPHVQTPVLDEMAASGIRFDRFYAAHPSCSPTRGSFLTGRHPNRFGTFTPNYSLRPEEFTIAHLLKKAGYMNGHFGKWHVGTVKAESPTNPGAMGFDEWVSHDNFFELNPSLSVNGAPPEVFEGESSMVVVDKTMRFIEKATAADKPFLAVVWFGSPHEPYSGLPEDLALYDELPEMYEDRDSVRLTSNETGLQVRRPLGDVLRERYAEITAMDRSIGVLREFLEAEGLRENTIVWYCGDNGTPSSGGLASPLRGRKGQMYEGGIRVPAVVEWPAQIHSAEISTLNSVTSDLLPTIAALTETKIPHDRPLDGINLLPLIEGNLDDRPEPIFFWQYNTSNLNPQELEPWVAPSLQVGTTPLVKLMNGVATRRFRNFHHPEINRSDYSGARVMLDNEFKLVIHGGPGPNARTELFNLELDPAEENNLADSEAERLGLMKEALRTWQTSVLNSLTGADY